jgi:Alkylmercury lyase
MLPGATALRMHVYDQLLRSGSPPTIDEIAAVFDCDVTEARRALADLRIGKTILVHPRTGEIWMAGPFSAGETSYRVTGPEVRWFANCAWDMLGVAVLAAVPVRIDAACSDCGAPMSYHVDPADVPPEALPGVVHFLVPARRWYEDIGYT